MSAKKEETKSPEKNPADPSENNKPPEGFWSDLKEHPGLCVVLVIVALFFFALPAFCAWPSCEGDWKGVLAALVSGLTGAAGVVSVVLACYSVKKTWESDKVIQSILEQIRGVTERVRETQEKMGALQEDEKQLQQRLCEIASTVEHVDKVANEIQEGVRKLGVPVVHPMVPGDLTGFGTAEEAAKGPSGKKKTDGFTRTGEPDQSGSVSDDSDCPDT